MTIPLYGQYSENLLSENEGFLKSQLSYGVQVFRR